MCSTTIPSSFYEAKRKLRDLGLGYETIHTCKYDCVLYWKELVDLQHCPICGEARYKSGGSTLILNFLILLLIHETPFGIQGRISFMGHRRYLPKNHVWRRSRLHDGKVERKAPLVVMNGHEILEQLNQLEFPVMRKTKDTTNAWLDLQDLKIRKDLHLVEMGNQLVKPHASYTLTSSERVEFCKLTKSVLELRESANLSNDFFSLAMGPSFDVRCYNGCIVGGVRFHIVELDSRRTTQNSGVMVIGESDASGTDDNNFYGVLDEMLHVQYPIDVDPTIAERPIVRHVTNNFIDDVDEHLSHASKDELVTNHVPTYLSDAMFLEFEDDLDNIAGGLSSVDDNTMSSSQQPATPTPRRRVQSRLLELEYHVAINGRIPMMIAHGAEKPISPHWGDVEREYIEVVKDDFQRLFVLDFNDQAMNRFVEHQMLMTFKEFQADCHRHFKKYNDPKEARANPPNALVGRHEDWQFLYDHYMSHAFQYELAERKGELVDCVELFRETHVRAEMFVSQATEDAHGSQPLSEDEICDQVLGKRPGYLKGLG
ncbi:CACTA en-spm transposon protein [Cucumis melo var. makuwa]|nr:CACTA en-spm transposon protein [Cucumis melo var. makuwa]